MLSLFEKNSLLEKELHSAHKENLASQQKLAEALEKIKQLEETPSQSNSPKETGTYREELQQLRQENTQLMQKLKQVMEEKEKGAKEAQEKEEEQRKSILALYQKNLFLEERLRDLTGSTATSQSTQHMRGTPCSSDTARDPDEEEAIRMSLSISQAPNQEREILESQLLDQL